MAQKVYIRSSPHGNSTKNMKECLDFDYSGSFHTHITHRLVLYSIALQPNTASPMGTIVPNERLFRYSDAAAHQRCSVTNS